MSGMYAQYGARFKQLVKEYGRVAIGVHLGVSATSIGGLYYAIDHGVDVKNIMQSWGLGEGALPARSGGPRGPHTRISSWCRRGRKVAS